MSLRRFFVLRDVDQGHLVLKRIWEIVKPLLKDGKELEVVVRDKTRSGNQNAQQWPYLQGFSEQLLWPVNGAMCTMSKDEWKDVLTAAYRDETVRMTQGLDGGVVMLGQRTSNFTEAQFREWMAFLKATAALRGVEPVYKSPPPDGEHE